MAFFQQNLSLENLVLFKSLFKKLLKHQNIVIDLNQLIIAYNPMCNKLNAFDDKSFQQHKEWLEFSIKLFSDPKYINARDTLMFATKIITDYYSNNPHYTGEIINNDYIMYNFHDFYISKEICNFIKIKHANEYSKQGQELKLYKEPIRPWFRDLIIPYKHEIEKYGISLDKNVMAEKYTNMIQRNRYPAPFSQSLPISIAGTKKTPLCKIMKSLLSVVNNYYDPQMQRLVFPYIEFCNFIVKECDDDNKISKDKLQIYYHNFRFCEKYKNLMHGNSVNSKLSHLKAEFLLLILNSQIKIQR